MKRENSWGGAAVHEILELSFILLMSALIKGATKKYTTLPNRQEVHNVTE